MTRESAILPDLPSLFAPVRLREGEEAVARAAALAPARGAGTLAWLATPSRTEAAVVLEPEEALARARPALLAALSATADALAAHGPPEMPVTLRWPDRVLFNGAEIGRARLAVPEGAAPGEVPAWLVAGMELRLAFPPGWEPGLDPGLTSLAEEGFDLPAEELVSAWARHLMATLADWQGRGFPTLAERVLARLEPLPGGEDARRGLDPATGDLVLETDGARRRVRLGEAP